MTTPSINPKLPRNFMTPWILLLLKQWKAHGYALMQYLNQMGFPTVDHATLYKELRNLDKEGFISSEWETGGNGPAKRVYSITDSGEEMLRGYADVIAGYQRMVNGFFDLYAEAFGVRLQPQPTKDEASDTADHN